MLLWRNENSVRKEGWEQTKSSKDMERKKTNDKTGHPEAEQSLRLLGMYHSEYGHTSFWHNKDTPLSIPPEVENQNSWGHRKWAIALWRRDVGPATIVHTNLWRYMLIFYLSITTFNIGLSPSGSVRVGVREENKILVSYSQILHQVLGSKIKLNLNVPSLRDKLSWYQKGPCKFPKAGRKQ